MEHKEMLISRHGNKETICILSSNYDSLVKLGDMVEKAIKEGPPVMENITSSLAIIAKKDKKAIFPEQGVCNKLELYGFIWYLIQEGAIPWSWIRNSRKGAMWFLNRDLKNAKATKEKERILNSARKMAETKFGMYRDPTPEQELYADFDESQRAEVEAIRNGLARGEE